MDWKLIRERLNGWGGRYKYGIAVLLLGILLMNLPTQKVQPVEQKPAELEDVTLSQQLEQILGKMKGVGGVEVLITEASSKETVFQTDLDEQNGADSGTRRVKTVLLSSGSSEEGLIRTVIPASYRGAIVVCDGGDDPSVSLAVVQAVSKVTGIGADRIAVLKMK